MLLAISALAAACGTNDSVHQVVTAVGSDTTQDVMGAIADSYNTDTGYNPDPDDNQNVLAIVTPDPGDPVPGDDVTSCPDRTYRNPPGVGETLRPNGSGAGRDALLASVQAGDGCIDIARSSAGPRAIGTVAGTDLASFEYFAYALDAVGITTASTLAPADNDITLNEVRGIYNCTITNWSQLGGGNGAIERYWPQAGSGTRSFAQSDILGFDPTTINTCPITLTQENTGATIAANGDQQRAVVPYSVANWVAMSRDTITDDRDGQEFFDLDDTAEGTLGFVNPVVTSGGESSPNPAVVSEGNVRLVDSTPAYPGVRFVFNVIDNSTGANSYTAAKRFVGFDNVASPAIVSPLCSGSKNAILLDYGFGPLSNLGGDPRSLPTNGTTCRLY